MSPRFRDGLLALAVASLVVGAPLAAITGSFGVSEPPSAGDTSRVDTEPSSPSSATSQSYLAGSNPSTASLTAASSSTISAPPLPTDSGVNSTRSTSTAADQVLAALAAKGVPLRAVYLPNLAGEVHTAPTDGHIAPYSASGPEPYGIGESGLRNDSGTITPFRLSTSSLTASFTTQSLSGISPDVTDPDAYGIQLDAVLNNVTLFGTTGYQFWTQDVFSYSPSLEKLQFLSNIWNFSGVNLSCNAFYAAGGHNECPEYYYNLSAPIRATYPLTVDLYLNSTLIDGRDAVFFNYTGHSASGTFAGTVDYAIFNSLATNGVAASTPAPAYVANGFSYNPRGLPDDFEATLGGPGGGANFDLLYSDSTYLTLEFYNASLDAYEAVPSAFNMGGDTGETSYGVNDAWAAWTGAGACAYCAELNAGPSFSYGLWNISSAAAETDWAAQTRLVYTAQTADAFVFVAQGSVFTSWTTTNWSLFQWAAADFAPAGLYTSATLGGIVMPAGTYTFVLLEANFDPYEFTEDSATCTPNPCGTHGFTLAADTTVGAYAPLWALTSSTLAEVTSGTDGYGYHLLVNDEFGPLGSVPCGSSFGCADFPWFGTTNDYLYPAFLGLWLNDVSDVDIASPPNFAVAFAGTGLEVAQRFGTPTSNDLQLLINDSTDVKIDGGTISGWWLAAAYFGPSQSAAALTLWNTTDAEIEGISFQVGGIGAFLYGGTDNTISGSTFVTSFPTSPDPYATVGAYYGATGLVEADFGDAYAYGADGAGCSYCDVISNNIFDTFVTATQLPFDPYTGFSAIKPMSSAWNVPFEAGETNIVGGDYLGGNYWWDYGTYWNPYNIVPDEELNPIVYYEFEMEHAPATYICYSVTKYCDYGGGDFYPLTLSPVYRITFQEVGLPSGTIWGAAIYETYTGSSSEINDDWSGYVYNLTSAPGTVTLNETAGSWTYYPYSENGDYAAPDGTATLVNGAIVVTVDFVAAYAVTLIEEGLPSGDTWYGEVAGGPNDTGYTYSTTAGAISVAGLLPGTYLFDALNDNGWATTVAVGSVTITDADVSVLLDFVREYVLTVHAIGLPSGVPYAFDFDSTTGGYGELVGTYSAWFNLTLPALDYTWSAAAGGFLAIPPSGVESLSGNETITITFEPAATLIFSETGLPSGSEWTVGIDQSGTTTLYTGTGRTISVTIAAGDYSYSVNSLGYTASPSSASGTAAAGNTTIPIVFATATGTLTGTVAPNSATLWVDGSRETLGSGGAFSVTLPVGAHSVEVTADGYLTYFNNVTISSGGTTPLTISLTAIPSGAGSGIGTMGWVLLAVLTAVAVALLATTLVFARRARRPPPPSPYAGTVGVAPGVPPPPGQPPAWQETPPPPPGRS